VTGDLPPDVRTVLGQLLRAGRDALSDDDVTTAREVSSTVRTVARNKLPAGPRRSRLLHGCDRVETLLDGEDVDTTTASAYLAAMERRLDDPDG
jgi:hypothetical protein